jgi:hypothetical protein
MTEIGVFNDEGLVCNGFFDITSAMDWARKNGTDLFVQEICPDHPEHARETCEECLTED